PQRRLHITPLAELLRASVALKVVLFPLVHRGGVESAGKVILDEVVLLCSSAVHRNVVFHRSRRGLPECDPRPSISHNLRSARHFRFRTLSGEMLSCAAISSGLSPSTRLSSSTLRSCGSSFWIACCAECRRSKSSEG